MAAVPARPGLPPCPWRQFLLRCGGDRLLGGGETPHGSTGAALLGGPGASTAETVADIRGKDVSFAAAGGAAETREILFSSSIFREMKPPRRPVRVPVLR